MYRYLLFVLLLAAVVLSACGGGGAPAAAPSSGNADNGKALFSKAPLGTNKLASCQSCHAITANRTMVGPTMFGMAATGAQRIKEAGYKGTAKSGAEYVREAIIDPDVHLAKGFGKGIMPNGYKDGLTTQEIDDLVAYLVTIK